MALPAFTMRQLLEAGVHFGHQTRRWNPKMASYLFGIRNGAHIIDLQQTAPLLQHALKTIRDIVAGGGRVLFVGTKRQASDLVTAEAKRCGQFYVNHRWLGGMLTNWKTISVSIKRLREFEEQLAGEDTGLTKKELLRVTRQRNKLERALGGIKDMGGLPDVLFVIDTNKEKIAIAEATKLGIPIVAVIDSNSDPTPIDYPIPGNDDAIRAINFYCRIVSDAVLDGIQEELQEQGADIGEAEELPPEQLPEPAAAAEPEPAKAAEPEPAPPAQAIEPTPAPEAEAAPAAESPAAAKAAPESEPAKAAEPEAAPTPAVEPEPALAAEDATEKHAVEDAAKDDKKAKKPATAKKAAKPRTTKADKADETDSKPAGAAKKTSQADGAA